LEQELPRQNAEVENLTQEMAASQTKTDAAKRNIEEVHVLRSIETDGITAANQELRQLIDELKAKLTALETEKSGVAEERDCLAVRDKQQAEDLEELERKLKATKQKAFERENELEFELESSKFTQETDISELAYSREKIIELQRELEDVRYHQPENNANIKHRLSTKKKKQQRIMSLPPVHLRNKKKEPLDSYFFTLTEVGPCVSKPLSDVRFELRSYPLAPVELRLILCESDCSAMARSTMAWLSSLKKKVKKYQRPVDSRI
jgi:chromosome segregation ATPase